jgi:beta-xylosidase
MRVLGKKKFVHGRAPLKRSKVIVALAIVLLIALVFVPWQTIVLHRVATVNTRLQHALLGAETTVDTRKFGPAPAPTLANLTDPLHGYGVAASSDIASLSTTALNKQLDDIVALGVGWVRFDVQWQNIQPKDASHYDWGAYDRVAKAAGAHHLKMLGVLAYTPAWARPGGCESAQCAPNDPAQFAQFAAHTAAHYQPMGLQAWEIWNEPNTSTFWLPNPAADAYTRLLQATYSAVKLANPQAIVVSGGLSPQTTDDHNVSELDFLQGMYNAGIKGFFDALGAHPYTYPLVPSHSTQQAWSRLSQTGANLRNIMIANGDGVKRIWITEFGAPTGGSGAAATMENYSTVSSGHVTEELQAFEATRSVELYKTYDWVGPLMWYSFKDASTNQTDAANTFGLLRADGSQKPAYTAFKNAISQ